MSSSLFDEVLGQVSSADREQPVVGSAGGGAVEVELRGLQHVARVTISPELAGDTQALEELVAAAMNNALELARGEARGAAMRLLQQFSAQ